MKPNSSFKLSKENKVLISNILDSHKKGEIKRALIQSQLHYEQKPRVNKVEKESD
jgi:hypothetical protein